MAELQPDRDQDARDGASPQPAIESPVDVRNAALTAIAAVALTYLLQLAQPVLIPVALGIFLSYPLGQLVSTLERLRIPRSIGAGVVLLGLSAGLTLAAIELKDQSVAIVEMLPEAAQRFRAALRAERRDRDGTLQKVQRAATEIERTAREASTPPTAARPEEVPRVQVVEPAFRAGDYLWWGSMGLAGFAGQIVMILFLVYFLLVAGDLYKRKIVRIASPRLSKKKVTVQILDAINQQVAAFIRIQLLTSALVGAVTGVALWRLGVQQPVVWGIAAGVLNSIPYFGPVIVSAGLTIVAFLQFGTIGRALTVAGVALAITALEGMLLTPALMGRAARMNPVAIFVGLIFWSWIWGLWGMVLAVPMMMLIKAVCDHVEDLQPLGELLGE